MDNSARSSGLYSILIHVAVIALVLAATSHKTASESAFVMPHRTVFIPPSPSQGRGGGGGQRDSRPASKGRLPKAAPRVFVPPVVQIHSLNPQLPIEPAIMAPVDGPLPQIAMPNYGDPKGVAGPLSGGPGAGGGIGAGNHGGVGDSEGPGYGPGLGGGGVGGYEAHVDRGNLTPPVLLWKTEPAYSEEARKARLQGTVVLSIEVDARGYAQNVRVLRSLGLGLDERAAEAVQMWRFRPAYRSGRPIAASAVVEVNFRLL